MQTDAHPVLKQFSSRRFLLPVAIGLAVAAFLIFRNFDKQSFSNINWTWSSSLWIFMALFSVVVRDLAYMMRIRVLTNNDLTWYRSFIVIMLWECSSALAPGIIGGGFFFAIFILSREGVNMGRSISVITCSSFLDGIFLVTMAPLVYLIAGKEELFSGIHLSSTVGSGFFYSFWTIYFIILAYKLFVAYALFINPYFVKRALVGIFSLPLLKRFKRRVIETGDQLIIASIELKTKNFNYWFYSLLATFASWTARYSIVNCIIHAFQGSTSIPDFVIYGKQIIMGIIILVSPTPGGSGFAEVIFNDFLGGFIHPGLAPTLAFLWRLISYYPYIIAGAIILPRWVKSRILDKV